MDDLLTIRDLKVGFDIHGTVIQAVNGVSFAVRKGTTVALVGESGSGKSTVAQSIMGILPKVGKIFGGEILYHDPAKPGDVIDIAALDRNSRAMRDIRGGHISIIFQEPMTSLSPVHTVGNQVGEALHLHRDVDRTTGRKITVETLQMVGFPDAEAAYNAYPFELSGGLRQRAMIAMALICRPAILIADEPTTALDVTIQAQILKLLTQLQSDLGMAILLITHDLGVVANLAEEVVVMYHGKVVESGPCAEIFAQPQHPYLKALFTAVPKPNMPRDERLVPIRTIEPGKAQLLRQRSDAPDAAPLGGPLLTVSHVSKQFAMREQGFFGLGARTKILAVDDVSFHVRRGECLGLVGESGCGKTTLSKLIMRALTPDTGEITYDDHGQIIDVLSLQGDDLMAFRRKIQFIFQDPFGSLNPRMTALDIITEPLIVHEIGTPAERMELVKELMRLVGLDVRFLRRYPHSFSGGQRQRLGIARALALQPELLICDEPVSSLDVSIQAQILNLLKDLQNELGLTYMFVSHNLAVVDYMADRIAVMCDGRLVEIAPSDVLFATPVHPYTKALLAAVPFPDPDRKLDFAHLSAVRLESLADYPPPFGVTERDKSKLVEIGREHFVRAASDTAREAILS